MVKGGEAFSPKGFRIIVIKICNPNFHQKFVKLHHSYLEGQQSCSDISRKGRRYLQCTVFKYQKVNLELSGISSDHKCCRVPS